MFLDFYFLFYLYNTRSMLFSMNKYICGFLYILDIVFKYDIVKYYEI